MKTSIYRLAVIMLSLAAVGLAGISATNAASSNDNANEHGNTNKNTNYNTNGNSNTSSYGNTDTQQQQPQGGCCG
ncbi:MAG: hypothetical protein PHU21_06430 [Elusimicrobia bacterium]|nr:hypothetical protein [Elusimicrobiota bacterium]